MGVYLTCWVDLQQCMDPTTSSSAKLYAFHALEVDGFRKANDYGSNVSVVTTADGYFVPSCKALHSNPFEVQTLNRSRLNTC